MRSTCSLKRKSLSRLRCLLKRKALFCCRALRIYGLSTPSRTPGYSYCPLVWNGWGSPRTFLDRLSANLQQAHRACRAHQSRVCSHSRGMILRDIKPRNFAIGAGRHCNIVYLFDFGLAKLFVDPANRAHIPFREGLVGLGTVRYASANVHFGREQGRRDGIEALGYTLLYFFHGRLPWQGIYAPSVETKLLRIGEMKARKAFDELLAQSLPEFREYFNQCRSLAFEEKPDYVFLKDLFRERMNREGWSYDWRYDWLDPSLPEKGTLIPEEYVFDDRFVEVDRPDWRPPYL